MKSTASTEARTQKPRGRLARGTWSVWATTAHLVSRGDAVADRRGGGPREPVGPHDRLEGCHPAGDLAQHGGGRLVVGRGGDGTGVTPVTRMPQRDSAPDWGGRLTAPMR